jgi:hypothetical protein
MENGIGATHAKQNYEQNIKTKTLKTIIIFASKSESFE